jgi:DNA-binding transcriptional ArsR family regulator
MYRRIAAQELANFLGVIAHPDRIRIIEELHGGELDVTALQTLLDLPQSFVSRHLGLMKSNKIVAERKEGRRVYYHLCVPALATWLIAGLDIIGEKDKTTVLMAKALVSAKKLWQKTTAL